MKAPQPFTRADLERVYEEQEKEIDRLDDVILANEEHINQLEQRTLILEAALRELIPEDSTASTYAAARAALAATPSTKGE